MKKPKQKPLPEEAKKRGPGRRGDLTDEREAKIIEGIKLCGLGLKSAGLAAGISESSVMKWRDRGRAGGKGNERYVQFLHRTEEARASREKRLSTYVMAGAAKDPKLALEVLARLHPEGWQQRIAFNVDDAISRTIAEMKEEGIEVTRDELVAEMEHLKKRKGVTP